MRRLFSQTSARQMLHREDGRSGAGDAFFLCCYCLNVEPRRLRLQTQRNTKKVRNWRQGLAAPAESSPRRQPDRPPGSLSEGFDCADDVIVPLQWAPDFFHKSGLEYVRGIIVDAILPPMFHNASKRNEYQTSGLDKFMHPLFVYDSCPPSIEGCTFVHAPHAAKARLGVVDT